MFFPGKPFSLHRLSQKIKVIQLLTVPHDVTLDLAGVNPGDIVLHIPGNQVSRVIDDLSTNTNLALLDKGGSL